MRKRRVLKPLLSTRGHTPIQNSWDRHDRLPVISALTVSPRQRRLGLYFQVREHNIRTADAVESLRWVHRRLRRRIIVVLDRWSVHRAAVRGLVQADAAWFEVEWLPAYAPELNPCEGVWNHTKHGELANYIPEDIDTLQAEVERSATGKRASADLLRSFFKHAQLSLWHVSLSLQRSINGSAADAPRDRRALIISRRFEVLLERGVGRIMGSSPKQDENV